MLTDGYLSGISQSFTAPRLQCEDGDDDGDDDDVSLVTVVFYLVYFFLNDLLFCVCVRVKEKEEEEEQLMMCSCKGVEREQMKEKENWGDSLKGIGNKLHSVLQLSVQKQFYFF